ncbi:MAG: hypothetical protein ACLPJW_11035 [Rhodomicrobium sp.]
MELVARPQVFLKRKSRGGDHENLLAFGVSTIALLAAFSLAQALLRATNPGKERVTPVPPQETRTPATKKASSAKQASIHVSDQQKTEIHKAIFSDASIHRYSRSEVNFNIAVGTRIQSSAQFSTAGSNSHRSRVP